MIEHPPRLVALATAALAVAVAALGAPAARAGIVPLPDVAPSGRTPPPLSATATPTPSGNLVSWSGQILDDRSGFVFFTTGDGFRIAPGAKVTAIGGGPTTLAPRTRVFAKATFDTGTGAVTQLALSATKLPEDANYANVKAFAVALSTPYPNPDLARHGGFSGRAVFVTFIVEVPSRTPFSDPIFIATDTSGWSPTAVRMDRVDANHYRVSDNYASGTKLLYRYTRGSWSASERDQHGQQVTHEITIGNGDTRTIRDDVTDWGDQEQFAPELGNSIPTPFNPVPFFTPPRR